jgi:hypothetical protein
MSANSISFDLNNINLSSIKEEYLNLKEEEMKPIELNNSFVSFLETRAHMVNWLTFLCNTLNFNDQTLFRCVSIFDQYISKIIDKQKEMEEMTQEKLNLITISCLSLATKLEEVNCNYIAFLNEKVLNIPNEKIFTNKDLTNMELTILKELKFNTIYSTPLDFLEIYAKIFSHFLGEKNTSMAEQIISNIRNISINLIKNNINNICYLANTMSHFSYLCFIQSLNEIKMMNSSGKKQIEKAIINFGHQLVF